MKLPILALIALLPLTELTRADDTDFTAIGQANTQSGPPLDSCRYVDVAAVENMVGEKLAVPPFSTATGSPDENGSTCRLQFTHGRSLDIDVLQQGGDKMFELLTGITTKIDRETAQAGNLNKTLGLAGDWDEVRMVGIDKMAALQGDKLVLVSESGFLLFQDAVGHLIQGIYDQIEAPKGPKGSDGLAAAQKLYGKQPQQVDACDLLSDAATSAIVNAIPKTRKSYGKSCDLDFGPGQGYVGVKVSWSGGASEMAMIARTMGAHLATGIWSAADVEKLKAEADAPLPATWEGPGRALSNPAWEAGFGSGVLLGAVHDDVYVSLSIASQQLTPQQDVNLLAAAMKKAVTN